MELIAVMFVLLAAVAGGLFSIDIEEDTDENHSSM